MSHRQRHLRHRRGRSRLERAFLLVVGSAGAGVLVALAALVGYVVAVTASTPDVNHIAPAQYGRDSVIYAANGSELGTIAPNATRSPIPWQDMPLNLRRATVAVEDQRFYEHGGVDYQGIVRAALADIVSGSGAQGGSTIAQQLVRAVYLKNPRRNISRKIREVKLATELEQHHSKTWILWQYLNNVPYGTYQGRTALGVEAAAQLYLAKHASDLTLADAALLAGLPQAPSVYNPFQDPAAALRRRTEVLRAMVRQGYATPAEAARAERAPLNLVHPKQVQATQRKEPYFFDYVQEQLIQRYGVEAFRDGGFRVYTTVDPQLQQAGRQAIQSELPSPDDPSSAVVAIDPQTGYIRAMADSGNYGDRSFNLAAQGRRQPGSAFKAMVLTTAILDGVDPDSTYYVSKPVAIPVPGYGRWRVQTYNKDYAGAISLTHATLRSDNTVYAQLDVDLGPKNVARVARLLGIDTPLEGVPSEGLGGLHYGVSPLEMASAYATLASGGVHATPQAITRVVLPDGHVDQVGQPKRQRVIPEGVAYEVTKILRENIDSGTGTSAAFGCPAAGKTGTTDHYNDAWFVGYTPTLTSAVWVGYPNSLRAMNDVHGGAITGSTIPARIWHDFMSSSGYVCKDFPVPAQLPQLSPYHGHYAVTGTDTSVSSLSGGAPTDTTANGAATGTSSGTTGTGTAAGTGIGTGAGTGTGTAAGTGAGPPGGTSASPGGGTSTNPGP